MRTPLWAILPVLIFALAPLAPASEIARQDLPAAIRAAADDFQPVGPEEIAAKRVDVRQAAAAVRQDLAASDYGRGWIRYLMLDELQSQWAAGAELNFEELLLVALDRLPAGRQSLDELQSFARYETAFRDFLAAALVGEYDKNYPAEEFYREALADLAEGLERWLATGDREALETAGYALDDLERRQQAPTITAAVRQYYWAPAPNLYTEMSASVATSNLRRDVDEREPFTDYIDGAWVYGMGHTVGRVYGTLVPNDQTAEMRSVFVGRTFSDSVAYAEQATVWSTGVTTFAATSKILFDGESAEAHWPCVKARACVEPYCVKARLPRMHCDHNGLFRQMAQPLADEIAWMAVEHRRERTNYFSARAAERRIAREYYQEIQEGIQESRAEAQERFRGPLQRRGAYPETLRTSTTAEELRIVALKAQGQDLPALSPPPPGFSSVDMNVRMHETYVNNSTRAMYGRRMQVIEWGAAEEPTPAGRTINRDTLNREMNAFREYPEPVDPEEENWEMTFRHDEPIDVEFRDGLASITFRLLRFRTRPGAVPVDLRVNITAVYDFVRAPEGRLIARRQSLESSGRIPGTRRAAVDELLERFGESLREQVDLTDEFLVPLPGVDSGELILEQARTENGWLILGYQMAEESAPEPEPEL